MAVSHLQHTALQYTVKKQNNNAALVLTKAACRRQSSSYGDSADNAWLACLYIAAISASSAPLGSLALKMPADMHAPLEYPAGISHAEGTLHICIYPINTSLSFLCQAIVQSTDPRKKGGQPDLAHLGSAGTPASRASRCPRWRNAPRQMRRRPAAATRAAAAVWRPAAAAAAPRRCRPAARRGVRPPGAQERRPRAAAAGGPARAAHTPPEAHPLRSAPQVACQGREGAVQPKGSKHLPKVQMLIFSPLTINPFNPA